MSGRASKGQCSWKHTAADNDVTIHTRHKSSKCNMSIRPIGEGIADQSGLQRAGQFFHFFLTDTEEIRMKVTIMEPGVQLDYTKSNGNTEEASFQGSVESLVHTDHILIMFITMNRPLTYYL